MKQLVQWQHDIQKSIETSCNIYADILIQGKIGEKKFDTNFFDICANSGASYCAKPDGIDFIPGIMNILPE